MNVAKYLLSLCLLLCAQLAYAIPSKVWNVAPVHWYIGFSDPELEIIVNADQISSADVEMEDYEGVEFIGKFPSANRHVAYFKVKIKPNAKPGFLVFRSKVSSIWQRIRGERDFSLKFELKARRGSRVHGYNNKDVLYHILPDRFANGDPSNDNSGKIKNIDFRNRASLNGRHGGDIQGIIDNLNYLQDLGVTTLLLNPVQTNDQSRESYSGFAITNHYEIDPRFGGNAKYLELIDKMKVREMKMVMDIVPNHFGSQHWMFSYFDTGWFNSWDTLTSTNHRHHTHMDLYAAPNELRTNVNGWLDRNLPDVNQKNEHMARYLNQLYLWWVEYADLSGYRIDTYAYADQDYMNALNPLLLKNFPNLGIFGETRVSRSPSQAFFVKNNIRTLSQNTLPSVTDFQMYLALNEAVTKDFSSTEGLNKIFQTLSDDFLYQNPELLVTFIDNHNLSRIYSAVGGDYSKWKMAINLLMTVRGIPCIYYGTEVLMDGTINSSEALVRKDFPGGWVGDSLNLFKAAQRAGLTKEAFDHVKYLINLRRNSPVLQSGKTLNYEGENGTYVFFRVLGKETYMIASNQMEEVRHLQLARFRDVLYNKTKFSNPETNEIIDVHGDKYYLNIPAKTTLILKVD